MTMYEINRPRVQITIKQNLQFFFKRVNYELLQISTYWH